MLIFTQSRYVDITLPLNLDVTFHKLAIIFFFIHCFRKQKHSSVPLPC